MACDFIIKYKVLHFSSKPIGGKDTILHEETDLNKAIEWAKNYSKDGKESAVVEFRYASEKNLRNNFHFDYSLKWASYL